MDRETHQRAMRIFTAALRISPTNRVDFLARECSGDETLRREVESLLEHDDDRSLADVPSQLGSIVPPTLDPVWIGPYRILRRVGEGGMGIVYEATQQDPPRSVALKVVRTGMDCVAASRRFQLEREALARMDHPGIATVFDAGVSDSGRPYFVMEFVDGLPIHEWCRRNRADLETRISLMIEVCGAVQHAHRKGIIHRDLKPSNLLVTTRDGVPSPKVIDFGIAAVVAGGDLNHDHRLTEHGAVIGTPAYMSPEQLGRVDQVDTRSDVYALGAVLYELLAGIPPFEWPATGALPYDEVLRSLRELDPPRPSVRVRRDAADSSRSQAGRLEGDLDAVVMKAIDKDPERRYASPAELAEDLVSFVAGEPVRAAPPGALRQIRRVLRRHRLWVASGLISVLALVAATVTSLGFARSESRARLAADAERREALRHAATVQAINQFVTEDILAGANPQVSQARDRTLRDALDDAAAVVDDRFPDQPLVCASIHETLGHAYVELGDFERGVTHHREALRLREQHLGPAQPDTLHNLVYLGNALMSLGEIEAGIALHRRVLRDGPGVFGDDHATILRAKSSIASQLLARGDLEEAERIIDEVLRARQRRWGPTSKESMQSKVALAEIRLARGLLREAEAALLECDAEVRSHLGELHPLRLRVWSELVDLYRTRREDDRALPLAERLLVARRQVLGEEHPATWTSMESVGAVLTRLGRTDEAAALLEDALSRRSAAHGDLDLRTIGCRGLVAGLRHKQGRLDEAAEQYRRVIDDGSQALSPQHDQVLTAKNNLASVCGRLGDFARAAVLLREVVDGERAALPEGHWKTGAAIKNLGSCLLSSGRDDQEVVTLLSDAYDILAPALGEDHPLSRAAAADLASLHERRGDADLAAEWAARR